MIRQIEDLLLTNQLFTGRYDRLWAQLEAHRIAERAETLGYERDGCVISPARQQEIWAWLNRAHRAGTLRRWA
jgi:hypothetical protein